MYPLDMFPPEASPSSRTALIPIDFIQSSPYQMRRDFSMPQLEQLADSIARHGLLQPITVRQIDRSNYELIAGERRLRASKMAGEKLIKATVMNVDEKEAALLALAENIQREDLNFFEEAEGYRQILANYHMTQQNLAEQLGVSQPSIANKLRLLQLEARVRERALERGLSERHCRALLNVILPFDQLALIEEIYSRHLSVRQTEELIERRHHPENLSEPESAVQSISRAWRDWRLFANSMKSAVNELKSAGLPASFQISEQPAHIEMRIIVPRR